MKFTVDLKVTTQVGKETKTTEKVIDGLKEKLNETGRLAITGFTPHKVWSKGEGRYKGMWVMVEGTVEPKEGEGPNLTAFFIAHTIGKAIDIEKPKIKDIKIVNIS